MLSIVELVVPLFGLILFGYLSGRIAKIPLEGLAWMNFFIVYIALPALFFQLLSVTPVEQFTQISFILVSAMATFAVFCLIVVVAYWRNRGNLPEATIQGLAAAYGNIGYLGPPLALAAFGPAAAVPVALIFCFENTMHFTLAPLLMSASKGGGSHWLAIGGKILKQVFTHPFILATIVGVLAAVFEYKPPTFAVQLLDYLANAAGPCALFAMGVTAALRPLKRIPSELSYILPAKLLIHPLLVYVLLIWLVPGLEAIWLYSAVLLAALPTATNVFVIAQQYGIWQERASSVVVVSTVLSMLTVTGYLYLAQSGWLSS